MDPLGEGDGSLGFGDVGDSVGVCELSVFVGVGLAELGFGVGLLGDGDGVGDRDGEGRFPPPLPKVVSASWSATPAVDSPLVFTAASSLVSSPQAFTTPTAMTPASRKLNKPTIDSRRARFECSRSYFMERYRPAISRPILMRYPFARWLPSPGLTTVVISA